MRKTSKKWLTMIALTLLSMATASGRQLYLSPDGTGNGRSVDRPMGDVVRAFAMLQAGDTLWVRGGVYELAQTVKVVSSGTSDHRICVFAYEGEHPVFDFSGQNHDDETTAKASRGILHNIGANYWHYRGLEICHAADNGMKLEGSFCVVERCVFHGCGDTGLQQGFGKGSNGENTRNADFLYGRYNIVVNCDSYDNIDKWSNGGDADGFAIKLFPGPGNEFHGCRAWENSDDAWDLYYTYFPVLVDNCWALKSGRESGNGNGFKMGGLKQGGTSVGAHVFKNCVAAWNAAKGYDRNHHQEGCYIVNSLAFQNNINYAYKDEKYPVTYGNWHLWNDVGFSPVGGKNAHNHVFTDLPDSRHCNWLDIEGLCPLDDHLSDDGQGNTYIKYKQGEDWKDYTSEYVDLTYETAIGPRQANGDLPADFARLRENSLFVDKGMAISGMKTEDAHKKEYEYAANAPANYSIELTIPYVGEAPDYGPFERGIDNNDYALQMPVNDGTVDDAEAIVDTDPRYFEEKIVVNNYLFQDAEIVDSVSRYITADSQLDGQGVKPEYYGKGGDLSTDTRGQKYGDETSFGAYRIPKTGWVEFTLPSMAVFKSNIYCTGNRTLDIMWHYADDSELKTATRSMATGTALIDVAGMIGYVKKEPIVLRISNTANKGDMFLTDLTLGVYQEVDEEGSPIATRIKTAASSARHDIYPLDDALIVYGAIASLRLFTPDGRRVGGSEGSQYVSTSSVAKGQPFVVVVRDCDGSVEVRKLVKR